MDNSGTPTLYFVYNAKSGWADKLLDGLHKAIRPNTYECTLCAITFGVIGEEKVWKQYRQAAQIPMEFFYKDEFQKKFASKFGHKFTYPLVLVSGETGLEILITTRELNNMKSAGELIALLGSRTSGLL